MNGTSFSSNYVKKCFLGLIRHGGMLRKNHVVVHTFDMLNGHFSAQQDE